MKYPLSICAVVLLTIFTASAQVASHAPTELASSAKHDQPGQRRQAGGASQRDGAYRSRFAA